MSTVQWQETILHEGTEEERDAAFLAFQSNKMGQHFVFGGPRTDNAPAPAKKAKGSSKPSEQTGQSAKDRVADLNRRMQEARERRGSKPTKPTPKAAPKPSDKLAEADSAIKAFMGHKP